MIKVLVILTDTNIGGAGRALLEYLGYIDRGRFCVTVVLPEGSALVPLVSDKGFDVIEAYRCRDRSYERGAVAEYKRIIRRVSPNIVHTHSALSGRIAAYLCGVKVRISTRHCVDAPIQTGRFLKRRIMGMLCGILSTRIIAVCNAVSDSMVLCGVSRRRISVIPNGVSPVKRMSMAERTSFRRSAGISDGDFVGLVSARLEACKGHRTVIEAARIIRERMGASCCIRFIFMGDGSERDSLVRMARAYGVQDMILFAGFVSDTSPWYGISDVVVNASETEALSLAILEGMSLRLPAVATAVGGNPEAVRDGENGILVPVGDLHAMADGILRLAFDRELYGRLSDGAVARYERDFTAETMTRRIMALYESETEK